MDPNLNKLLKWGIEHSAAPATDSSTAVGATITTPTNADNDPSTSIGPVPPASTRSQLNPELLASLFGGPSEADLMKAAVELITDTTDPDITLDAKLIAFDNLEQLIESLDNANNLENLALWSPLLSMLSHAEPELRKMAAWCVGTAVQNNVKTQERLLAMGGIPQLVDRVLAADEAEPVRRKAVYALSSAVRNYQPAMDVAQQELARRGHGARVGADKVDATNMEAIDEIIDWLRDMCKSGVKP